MTWVEMLYFVAVGLLMTVIIDVPWCISLFFEFQFHKRSKLGIKLYLWITGLTQCCTRQPPINITRQYRPCPLPLDQTYPGRWRYGGGQDVPPRQDLYVSQDVSLPSGQQQNRTYPSLPVDRQIPLKTLPRLVLCTWSIKIIFDRFQYLISLFVHFIWIAFASFNLEIYISCRTRT